MTVISFAEKQENAWVVAGWVCRQILEDALSHSAEDPEMATDG
jgi:hypothetical protein